MTEITIKGFIVATLSDPNVGNATKQWVIKELFFFANLIMLEEFRENLRKTFETYSGNHTVVHTFEELEEAKKSFSN